MDSRNDSTYAILRRQFGTHEETIEMLFKLKMKVHSSFVKTMENYFVIELDASGRISYCKSKSSELELGVSRMPIIKNISKHESVMEFLVQNAEKVTAPITDEDMAGAYNGFQGTDADDEDVVKEIQNLRSIFENIFTSQPLAAAIKLAFILQCHLSSRLQTLIKHSGRVRIVDDRIKCFLCKDFQLRMAAEDVDSIVDFFTTEKKESKGYVEQIFEALGSLWAPEVMSIPAATSAERAPHYISTLRFLRTLREFLSSVGSPLLLKFEEEIGETSDKTLFRERVSTKAVKRTLENMFEHVQRDLILAEFSEDTISVPFVMLNFSIMLRDFHLIQLSDLRVKVAKFLKEVNGSTLQVPVMTWKKELLVVLDQFTPL